MTVYYFQRQDGAVKIGTSGCFRTRLRRLRYEHGELVIVALEPGRFSEERARHRQFERYRIEGEWFRPDGRLRRHIRQLAATDACARELRLANRIGLEPPLSRALHLSIGELA